MAFAVPPSRLLEVAEGERLHQGAAIDPPIFSIFSDCRRLDDFLFIFLIIFSLR
jgi:hypothetical protein